MASGLLAPLVLAIWNSFEYAIVGFVVNCCLLQVSLTGQTFWRCVILGWVVDEDCIEHPGRRREALFVGGINFVNAIGRAAATGVVLLGLALAGLQVENCEQKCVDAFDAAKETCADSCDYDNLNRQPETVKVFILSVYYGFIPVCQILLAVLTYTFPIRGARLDAIYAGQARIYKQPGPATSVIGRRVVDESRGEAPLSDEAPLEEENIGPPRGNSDPALRRSTS